VDVKTIWTNPTSGWLFTPSYTYTRRESTPLPKWKSLLGAKLSLARFSAWNVCPSEGLKTSLTLHRKLKGMLSCRVLWSFLKSSCKKN